MTSSASASPTSNSAARPSEPGGKPRTCVVISYWVGRPPDRLFKLLRQARKVDAGAPFDVVVVCNGGDVKPLALPDEFRDVRVFNRENTFWNLGAWDHGWRSAGDYAYYLFLQDDCILKRPGWVGEFEFRMDFDAGVGLLGEEIMWDDLSWPFIRRATDRDLGPAAWPEGEPIHPLDRYVQLLEAKGVPPGEVGTHLPSIILFSSRKVLEEVGGFPLIGSTYREAVATEIGISRIIASKGYRLGKIRGTAFHFIGHPQWVTGPASWPGIVRHRAKMAVLKVLRPLRGK